MTTFFHDFEVNTLRFPVLAPLLGRQSTETSFHRCILCGTFCRNMLRLTSAVANTSNPVFRFQQVLIGNCEKWKKFSSNIITIMDIWAGCWCCNATYITYTLHQLYNYLVINLYISLTRSAVYLDGGYWYIYICINNFWLVRY